jgi:hypothetical protein
MKLYALPPKDKTIIPPEGGWKEKTYYVVEVSFHKGNPIHRSILYVGFSTQGCSPLNGSYTTILNATYEGPAQVHNVHYLKVLSEIKELSEC